MKLAQAVEPRDFREWLWLQDVVDLGWEAARARRAIATRLSLARRDGITGLVNACRSSGPPADAKALMVEIGTPARVDRIFRGDPKELEALQSEMASIGLGSELVSDLINSAAYLSAVKDVALLQQIVDRAHARRDDVLREIDRSRESYARRLRPAVPNMDEVIDAEFE